MFVVLIMVIGFFVTGGTLGANIIGAFDWVQYFWWFVVVLVGILSLAVIFGASVLSADAFKGIRGGALVGTTFGMILSVVIMAYSTGMLWLTYYIQSNIIPTVDSWSDLGNNAHYGIIAYFGLLLASILSRNKIQSK